MFCGYAWLREAFGLQGIRLDVSAEVSSSVNRKFLRGGRLLVPPRMAPSPDDLLAQVCFALKHETVNPALLEAVLPAVEPGKLETALEARPGSIELRKAACLWEHLTGGRLSLETTAKNYAPLLDPRQYLTGPARRDRRWKILLNGLGSVCGDPVVRRTARISSVLEGDLLTRLRLFCEEPDGGFLERIREWAVEEERLATGKSPVSVGPLRLIPGDRSDGFRLMMLTMSPGTPIEAFLEVVASCSSPVPGASAFAEKAARLDEIQSPLLAAALASAGFCDPDGLDRTGLLRLRRLLVERHVRRGFLKREGITLPVAAALRRQGFLDLPAERADLTEAVEAFLAAAEEAFDALLDEADYLKRFDTVERAVNAHCDLRCSDRMMLVTLSMAAGGKLTDEVRDRFARRVEPASFDFIEAETRRVLG